MALTAIDEQLNKNHPVALELANLRNAVARLQDEARQSALHIKRQAFDFSRANERVTQLERENTVLRVELGVLRTHPDPDGSPDSHPATLQVQQMTLLLRQANAKITAVEEVLQTRNTELVHAKSDVVKARHAADGAYELAARIRGKEEATYAKQRELEWKIRGLEEEKRMSDLVISDYADLVRSLETRLGRRSPTHTRSSSSSSSFGEGHLQPNELAAASTTTLAESISEGKNGLQKLLAEFSIESEQLHLELDRLQQDFDVAKVEQEAERKRGEQDRMVLAKALSELEKAKLDDNSAAQMVSRYMKFSQSSTDKLQSAMNAIRTRHDATINTLTAQLVDLSKKHDAAEDEASELRDAVDDLGGQMLKEIYGRRREVALRLRIVGREERLQEQLNRWIRKGEDWLDRHVENPPHSDHVKWLQDAKNILLSLEGSLESDPSLSGSLLRVIAAEMAVESLVQELQYETTTRLELEKHLILKIPLPVEQDPAPLHLRPTPPQQVTPDPVSNLSPPPPAELSHTPMSTVDSTPITFSPESPQEVLIVLDPPARSTDSPTLSPSPSAPEESDDASTSSALTVDVAIVVNEPEEPVQPTSPIPPVIVKRQEQDTVAHSHSSLEGDVPSSPPSRSPPPKEPLEDEPETREAIIVQETPSEDEGEQVHEPSPQPSRTLPELQLSIESPSLPPDGHSLADELTPIAPTAKVETETQPFPRPLSPLHDTESSVPFLSLPNGDHFPQEIMSPLSPQPSIEPPPSPPPVHPLVSRLAEVGTRYDDLQRAFRDCHLSLESLKADVSSAAGLSTPRVSGSKIAPELLRAALDRLDDFTEDARVELEIRKADEELLISGYQTLLSVPGALSTSPPPESTFFSLFGSQPPVETDDPPPPPKSEVEMQVQAFVDGTDPTVHKAQQSLQRKLADVQHDIAALKQAIYNPDPSPIDGPSGEDGEESSKASSWTSWITNSPVRLNKPLPGPPPTFGNVMTTPRLRHVSSLNFTPSSIAMPSQQPPRQSVSGDPRRSNDPFAALGLKIPMPSMFAHSHSQSQSHHAQAAPPPVQLPSVLPIGTPTEPRAPRARTVSTMYMIGLGARSASGPPSLMNRPRTFSSTVVSKSARVSSLQAPAPMEDGDVE